MALIVCLTAAVSYNAMFLQKGPHPAPMAGSGTTLTTSMTTDVPRRRRAPEPAASAPATSGDDTVRAIQRELTQRGYAPGPVDGIFGLVTRAAILAYQDDNKLPLTGAASSVFLERVVLGRGGVGDSEVPAETTALIRAIQQTLADLGYDPGPIDGIVGNSTRRAIKSFEKDRRLPVKGRVSGSLLSEILRVTGTQLADLPSG